MKETQNIDKLLEKVEEIDINVDMAKNKSKDITKRLEKNELETFKELIIEDKTKKITKEDIIDLDNFEGLKKEEQDIEENIDIDVKQSVNRNQKPIIIMKDVEVSYDGAKKTLKGINLEVFPGEFVYLVGPSGSGKSTLSKIIYRDVQTSNGDVLVDVFNVSKMKNRELHKLRQKIGVIFQDYKLLPDRTIYENVKYTLDVINYPRRLRKEKVFKILKEMGIFEQKDKLPNELSGGQQQRAAIARAIVNDPKIIVADEPTGNLDPKNTLMIMDILERINQNGTTIIMTTHDVGIVNKYQHRVILLEKGTIKKEDIGGYIYE